MEDPTPQEMREMLAALIFQGWSVEKVSLYDEEDVEGWRWTGPGGREFTAIGAWDELPPWPEEASRALLGLRSFNPATGEFADFLDRLLNDKQD